MCAHISCPFVHNSSPRLRVTTMNSTLSFSEMSRGSLTFYKQTCLQMAPESGSSASFCGLTLQLTTTHTVCFGTAGRLCKSFLLGARYIGGHECTGLNPNYTFWDVAFDSIAMLALRITFHLRSNRNACTFCKSGAMTIPCTCCSCKGKMMDKMGWVSNDCIGCHSHRI